MILTSLTVPPLEVNCYILADEKSGEGAVVDAGGNAAAIAEAINNSGVLALKYIIFTHGHFDHIGAVSALKEKFPQAEVCIGEAEASKLCSARENLSAYFGKAEEYSEADILLSEGDAIEIGGICLEVKHTPGHSRGSLCFICREEKLIFSGDTLFSGSIGRTDFPDGSVKDMMNSLKLLASMPEDYRVLPGHGEPTTIGRELETNIYLR